APRAGRTAAGALAGRRRRSRRSGLDGDRPRDDGEAPERRPRPRPQARRHPRGVRGRPRRAWDRHQPHADARRASGRDGDITCAGGRARRAGRTAGDDPRTARGALRPLGQRSGYVIGFDSLPAASRATRRSVFTTVVGAIFVFPGTTLAFTMRPLTVAITVTRSLARTVNGLNETTEIAGGTRSIVSGSDCVSPATVSVAVYVPSGTGTPFAAEPVNEYVWVPIPSCVDSSGKLKSDVESASVTSLGWVSTKRNTTASRRPSPFGEMTLEF